ncbi:hypothetical protein JAAARDRAFT_37747 [Jaapia argillacea MUCL 33604]|uniref:Phosphoribulokinase/uridine kinase domain-containing protein n=1 Tax=Jaapia argillacea MUCL 33604 TaxID=933084 RepID=A0A067PK82_9AGAM|nr:hypothetical protein JAAARDRAFT_37747 [Jaapia argillacea MUCL 33604]
MATENPPPAISHMASHILKHLSHHRSQSVTPGSPTPPLLVGVQGPQGSGKTYLTSLLRQFLTSPPSGLSVAVLSIDDLYLPHDGLVRLAEEYPDNKLLKGRGQPGTHDVALGTKLLNDFKKINDPTSGNTSVTVPIFDKSLFGGEGDRLPSGTIVSPPLDVVILEGWCMGFCPNTPEEIERRWKDEGSAKGLQKSVFDLRSYVRLEDALDVNERLRSYVGWWELLDVFIQIKPVDSSPYSFIYKWRLEQEHYMKSLNGGKGMTDSQVKSFVDRYIPGYIFFSDGITEGAIDPSTNVRIPPRWKDKGLSITIGETRDLVSVGQF